MREVVRLKDVSVRFRKKAECLVKKIDRRRYEARVCGDEWSNVHFQLRKKRYDQVLTGKANDAVVGDELARKSNEEGGSASYFESATRCFRRGTVSADSDFGKARPRRA